MTEAKTVHPMAAKRVVYAIPGMDAVRVRRDVAYRASAADGFVMDVYQPPQAVPGARVGAVVFVTGYPDPGFQRRMGCRMKDMGSYVSWAQLVAASGLVAITYANVNPAEDARAVLRYVESHAVELGVDANAIGIWSGSGNVPTALSLVREDAMPRLRCAALCYGFMLDSPGSTWVADAARTWGFANPSAGTLVADLARVPLFVARAGQDDNLHLNTSIDHFVSDALALDRPLTCKNLPLAPHAFDLMDGGPDSCETVRAILAFLRRHLPAYAVSDPSVTRGTASP